jgi:hypothetical protein
VAMREDDHRIDHSAPCKENLQNTHEYFRNVVGKSGTISNCISTPMVFSFKLVNMLVCCYEFFLHSFMLLENDFVFFSIELAEVNYRLVLPNIKEQ